MQQHKGLDLDRLNELNEEDLHNLASNSNWVVAKTNQYTKPSRDDALITLTMVIIKNTRVDARNCWVLEHTKGIALHNHGYGRVNFLGNKKLAHHVTYMSLKLRSATWVCPPGYDVSHLCGNNSCVNPHHLTAESRAYNMSRIGCKGLVTVTTSSQVFYVTFNMCSHSPRCLVETKIIDDNMTFRII